MYIFFFVELREDGFQPQTFLVQGIKALVTALKLWMKKDVSFYIVITLFTLITLHC